MHIDLKMTPLDPPPPPPPLSHPLVLLLSAHTKIRFNTEIIVGVSDLSSCAVSDAERPIWEGQNSIFCTFISSALVPAISPSQFFLFEV